MLVVKMGWNSNEIVKKWICYCVVFCFYCLKMAAFIDSHVKIRCRKANLYPLWFISFKLFGYLCVGHITTLQRTDLLIEQMLQEGDFPGAVQLCLECRQASIWMIWYEVKVRKIRFNRIRSWSRSNFVHL